MQNRVQSPLLFRALWCSLAVAVIAALAPVSAARAQAPGPAAPTAAQVRGLLSGIEDVPSHDDWRRLGEGVLPTLMSLYASPDEPPYVRLRAVDAVSAFPREATHTFLLAVARAEGQSDLFVRQAILALGRVAVAQPAGFGPRVTDELTGFLVHREPVVREAAARTLGAIGGSRATGALSARLAAEPDAVVRGAIQAALR